MWFPQKTSPLLPIQKYLQHIYHCTFSIYFEIYRKLKRNNDLELLCRRGCISNEDCTFAAPARFFNIQLLFFDWFLLFASPCQILILKAVSCNVEAFSQFLISLDIFNRIFDFETDDNFLILIFDYFLSSFYQYEMKILNLWRILLQNQKCFLYHN